MTKRIAGLFLASNIYVCLCQGCFIFLTINGLRWDQPISDISMLFSVLYLCFVYWFLHFQVDWRSWADVSHQMWLRHLSLWVCTSFSFSFFSFLFFFLGLYISFLQPSTCPIEIVQTAQLHCFQNQVWPVQSRLKRCDVSPTDEQVYNEMNIIHFFCKSIWCKKGQKMIRLYEWGNPLID